MKMFLISDNRDTVLGMRLAGIGGVIIADRKEAEREFDKALQNKEVEILILTEKAANFIRPKVNYAKQKLVKPLIVEIPDRHGTTKAEDYITGYVRESIGIKI